MSGPGAVYESLLSDSAYSKAGDRDQGAGSGLPDGSRPQHDLSDGPEEPETKFCERACQNYVCGYFVILIFALLLCFAVVIMLPPVGLVCAALAPGVVILLLVRRYYEAQITTGQLLGESCLLLLLILLYRPWSDYY
jgi:hypothetical protein